MQMPKIVDYSFMSEQTVVVLGASPKPERYSNRAVKNLADKGHRVLPVHPLSAEIHGQACYKSLADINEAIDTLTLYVGPGKSSEMTEAILGLKPQRIIMNPGAENDELERDAQAQGVEVIRGCTLVMLQLDQF
jgi:predicted CoA-binding protein